MSKQKDVRDLVALAAEAHSNLNAWGAVIALLEGGLFYGKTDPAVQRVIEIAKKRQLAYLVQYDEARAKASLKSMGL